jgi:glycosyltransferase involved in cell wall biosynthesis
VPMGAPIHEAPRVILDRLPDSIGLAVMGGCEDLRAYDAMLAGLASTVRDFPGAHVVVELCGPRSHDVWRLAQKYELLGSISGIDDAAQHRSLLTQCDVMLLPEQRGVLTSLMLEAMAGGMPVVAREDPFLDVVEDGESGVIVSSDDAQEWARAVHSLLANPERARRLGMEGRRLVGERHGSAQQISRLAATLEWICGSGAYPFAKSELTHSSDSPA